MKRVLVATVGLNPIPVALSVLTLKPDVVVLVCSEESKPEADRIDAVISKRLPAAETSTFMIHDTESQSFTDLRGAMGLRPPQEPLTRPVTWGEADDDSLGSHLVHMIGPNTGFILDYTGGTKVMVACMVEFHTVWHGGNRPELRCYVAGRDDALRFADSGERRLVRLDDSLSLRDRAFLNGYRYGRGWRRRRPSDGDTLRKLLELNRELGRSAQPVTELYARHRDVHCDPVGRAKRGEAPPAKDDNRQYFRGVMGEFILAELAVRVSTELQASEPGRAVEVLLNVEPVGLGDRRAEPVVELDLVWRLGNTVLVGESKRTLSPEDPRVDDQIGAAATRALMAPEVLGDAVTNIYWVVESSDSELGRAIEQLVRGLSHGPAIGYGEHWKLNSARSVHDEDSLSPVVQHLSKKVTELLSQHTLVASFDPWTRARAVEPGPQERPIGVATCDSILAIAGDSPTAAILTNFLPAEDRAVLMPAEQRESLGPLLGLGGVRTPEIPLGAALDEPRMLSLLEEHIQRSGHIPALYITPGTKAATAMMTAFALHHGAELIHVVGGQDAIVTRSATEQLTWIPDRLDWQEFVRREANISMSVSPTNRPITAERGRVDSVWAHLLVKRVIDDWSDKNGLDLEWLWPRIEFPSASPRLKNLRETIEMQVCPDAIALHDRQVSLVHAYVASEGPAFEDSPTEQHPRDERQRTEAKRRVERKQRKHLRDFMKQRVTYSGRIFGEAIVRTVVVVVGSERLVQETYDRPPFTIMSSRQRQATTRLGATPSTDTTWWEM